MNDNNSEPGTASEVTAPLHARISMLEMWAAVDERKIKRLCAMLVRADNALATCGVGKKSPVRININSALKSA